MELWPHQIRTLHEINGRRSAGVQRLCVQGLTGSGKTLAFLELARREVARGGQVVVYTNRKTIRHQISEVFAKNGLAHGVRAAGCRPALDQRVQVSSVMTERSRSLSANPQWKVHNATLVIIDECHLNRAKTTQNLLAVHTLAGAFITGWSATPVAVGHIYDEIISMASIGEMRQNRVLVHCDVYAPEEIDMAGVRTVRGEYHARESRKRVKDCVLVGNVIEHWRRLNPERKPSVLFAPGVAESRWFAGEFERHRISAEHIDARTPDRERQDVFRRWRSGETQVVCNYGILREGFDFKQCSHAILAQPTRKVSTYLQIVGRILRAAPGKTNAVLQDHVGAYWRHGSPNEERGWTLGDTDASLYDSREQPPNRSRRRPVLCRNCGFVTSVVRDRATLCPKCGENGLLIRCVRQRDGTLRLVTHAQDNFVRTFEECVRLGIRRGFLAGQVIVLCMARSGRVLHWRQLPYYLPSPGGPDWRRSAEQVWPWALEPERRGA